MGLTSVNPTKLINSSHIYLHESKDFKLNVADMEIWKNNKEKELFYTKLRHVNFTNNISTHSHLPEYRVRVKDVQVESAIVHINLEVPGEIWKNNK